MSRNGTSQESVLLLTLEEISQLVSHSHDPGETLANIVSLIQRRFHTDVCSVYQLEPERGELVLSATLGLRPAGVGQVRMKLGEGLTGLVAETMAPVMVDDAFLHPRFKYFPEAGEDPYHSFLGVPLVEAGAIQGVLVVQTSNPRSFSSDEIRMLVTVGAQLAPLVSGARLLGEMISAAHAAEDDDLPATAPTALRGTSLSPGTGLGQAYVANGLGQAYAEAETFSDADPALEKLRLTQAMANAREEISRLSRRVSALVGEDHGAVLQAQLMILQDRTIEQDLTACLTAGRSAEGALIQTLNKYVAVFQRLASPYFQERIFDIKDVFRRTLWHLRPSAEPAQAAASPSSNRLILVAHEASVLDLFSVDLDLLAGVAVEHGGPQSHAAILARTLGVPMIGQVSGLLASVRPGQLLLVDGTTGLIELDPSPKAVATHHSTPTTVATMPTAPAGEVARPGLPSLEANINLLCEVEQAVAGCAGGVGLYRTEFLFLARRTIPTEEEQVNIYTKLLKGLLGRPASIRTFDLRPDKLAHLASASSYPFDWRLVLEIAPLQKLFKDQVRAILRAAAIGPARILVPLVTRSELLDFVIETVGRARDELRREGLAHGQDVPLGIMIEASAALPMMETWAEHVDYFAFGTNDLIASALGVAREDALGEGRNDPLHPGLLRLIHPAIESARRAGKRVTVCGELASDPLGVVALAALKVDAVSVAVNRLGPIRQTLVGQSVEDLEALLPRLLRARTASEVREFLLPRV